MIYYFTFLLLCGFIFSFYVLAHAIADVGLQPREWATTKHKNCFSLLKHVTLYTVLCIIITYPASLLIVPLSWHVAFWIINGCFHFIVDAITSRGNKRAWDKARSFSENDPIYSRWVFISIVWICVDQIIHMWFLALSSLALALIICF